MNGLAVAAVFATLAVAGWLRLRERIARLEQQIRKLRELSTRRLTYRRVTDADRGLDAAGVTAAFDLPAAGLEVLGDLVEESESKLLTRWFVDKPRTTFGWVGLARAGVGSIPVALLASHRADGAVYTRRVPKLPMLKSPPFIRRQDLPPTTDLADALAKHRELAGEGDWIKIESLEDVIREMPRIRDKMIAWRDAQPPADLLDQDLRLILGKHYEQLGARLARKLGPQVPPAKVL